MSKGGQEAQHDNDRLRMINQGGVEMSMGRDPYQQLLVLTKHTCSYAILPLGQRDNECSEQFKDY